MVSRMKEEVKELWRLCFDDSEAFTELYFRMRYSEKVNIAIREGGRVVSALQMLPYPMTFCNRTVPTSYVSGACTHPDFREKGLMRRLLAKAFETMRREGVVFSTLIPAEPWLFGYYAHAGYASVFRYSVQELALPQKAPRLPEISVEPVSCFQEDVYAYLNRKLSERPCCIQHTAEDFRVIIEDLKLGDGWLFAAKRYGTVTGVAIVYKGSDTLTINELLTEDEQTETGLLFAIGRWTGYEHASALRPPEENDSHPLGMARIIHAEEALRLYASAFPEKEMNVALTDNQLPENDGYYHLHHGVCQRSGQPSSGEYIRMEIGELTERLLRPLRPYMSLMLN